MIATSGMAEGGRILGHLQRFIGDPRATVLFVGYQAEHTLGRRLLASANGIPASVPVVGQVEEV